VDVKRPARGAQLSTGLAELCSGRNPIHDQAPALGVEGIAGLVPGASTRAAQLRAPGTAVASPSLGELALPERRLAAEDDDLAANGIVVMAWP